MSCSPKKRIAILISGRGSNMLSLIKESRLPDFPATIDLVIADRLEASGLELAKNTGVATHLIEYHAYGTRHQFEQAINESLRAARIDLICLAGFMRILSSEFVSDWHNRIINIHPSLLPALKGLNTHARAIDAGLRISGCTVHIVRALMDEGPILAQAAVPVLPDDTADKLSARVLAAEHKIYPLTLALFASGKIHIDGEKAIYATDIFHNSPINAACPSREALYSPPEK